MIDQALIDEVIDFGITNPQCQFELAEITREYVDKVRKTLAERKVTLDQYHNECNARNRRIARLEFEISVLKGEASYE